VLCHFQARIPYRLVVPDRIEVRRVRRKIKQHRARRFDRLRDTGDLMYRKIVHDHDIAALECGKVWERDIALRKRETSVH